jgi:hypothetical protein
MKLMQPMLCNTIRKSSALLPLLGLAVLCAPAVRADDIAIVTGIGEYGNLPNATLPGIDNDVAAMTAALQKAGFKVAKLWNGQATEANIRQVFAQAARLVGPNDRFVYYQSSHGTQDHRLLTFDTTTTGEHTLSADDLKRLMAAIHTTRKSLIMDACFSGGIKGLPGQKVKFYPIRRFKSKDFARTEVHDRCDSVVRDYNPHGDQGSGGDPDDVHDDNQTQPHGDDNGAQSAGTDTHIAIFASSQDNEYSLVVHVDGQPCSVFTHFLAGQLLAIDADKGIRANHNGSARAKSVHASWNAVVQPTIRAVADQTQGRQTPVFSARYLANLVYTTSDSADADNGRSRASAVNLAQLYDLSNVDPEQLELRAMLSSPADANGCFHPNTRIHLNVRAGRPGYLFLINRDDEDNAQMVGWGKRDLNFNDPEEMVRQSELPQTGEFEVGQGTLRITTTAREGVEGWKAFLFTNPEQATAFARAWCQLVADKGKKVNFKTFAHSKLADVQRIDMRNGDGNLLFTSELRYRVTAQ